MQKQIRILELENELKKKLKTYAVIYSVFEGSYKGDKKIKGMFVKISFPLNVNIRLDEVVHLFELYYGHISKVGKKETITNGVTGEKYNQIDLEVEGDEE